MIDVEHPERAMLDLIQAAEKATGFEHYAARGKILERAEMLAGALLNIGERHPELRAEMKALHENGWPLSMPKELYRAQLQEFMIYQSIELFRESQKRLSNDLFADET